jgi:hypothetical protein
MAKRSTVLAFGGNTQITDIFTPGQDGPAGDTHTAATASLADVTTAYNLCSDGDTLVIPAGTPTWGSTFNVTKAIKIQGPGSYAIDVDYHDIGSWPLTITFSHGVNGINVNATGGTLRITGIKFLGTCTYGSSVGGAVTITSTNTSTWRVDNCYFNLTGNSIAWGASGLGGLVDHIYTFDPSCTYNNSLQAADTRTDSWGDWCYSLPIGWGGSSFVFIEDCTFWKDVADGSATTTATDAFCSGKMVFRHNHVRNSMIGWHGSESGAPERGGYAFEVYDNDFHWDRSDWKYPSAILHRAGTARIYNNAFLNHRAVWKTWVRRTETSFPPFNLADGNQPWDGNLGGSYPLAYPVLDQAGRGQAAGWGVGGSGEPLNVQPQALDKVYLWNNIITGAETPPVAHLDPAWVVDGRDYEFSLDSAAAPGGYAGYTYPHPLQTRIYQNYWTHLPLTENPVSQGSQWLNGAVDGLDWNDCYTTKNFIGGVGTKSTQYADPTAILKGTWGANQTMQGVVKNSFSGSGCWPEVELRLRSTMTAHSCTGYEVLFSCISGSSAYCQIIRWNGPFGDFQWLAGFDGAQYAVVDGDVIKATIIGTTINAYKNGSLIMTANDATFSTGNPGVGFDYGCSPFYSQFGFKSFIVTSQ